MTLTVLATFAVVAAYAYAVRVTPPGTVNPFTKPTTDPSADTLPVVEALTNTMPPAGGDYRVVTLTNLRQVEDLLDSLEAQGVVDREVFAIGENTFAVRWR